MKYKDILVNLLTATYRYVWKRETCDFYISSGSDKENLFDHLVTSWIADHFHNSHDLYINALRVVL